jgi:hypothetical protein
MSVWWLVFTGVDLYIGLIALDLLGRSGSIPPEKQGRLAVTKKVVIALLVLVVIAIIAKVLWR